jgi:hypothetical protein
MPTFVEKLQQDAMNPEVRVSDLLRRVKFTAVQLGLGKVEDWVEQELNGYSGVKPPDYRTVHGRPMAHHPYSGWQDLRGNNIDFMRRRSNNQAISSLEGMIATAAPDTTLHMPFPDKIVADLNKHNGNDWRYDLVIATNEIARIIDQVRSLVLDWALNLQKAGIMGSEVSFNDAEKEKAQAASTTIHIGSIGTMAGNIGQGNISGNNTIKVEQVQSILDQLKPHVPALSADGAGEALGERITALERAIKLKDPDISAVRGFITDLRNTLTGAAGNLIASGAVSALNMILGTGVPA